MRRTAESKVDGLTSRYWQHRSEMNSLVATLSCDAVYLLYTCQVDDMLLLPIKE
jgi:hypothetical protein